jgi:hypothetical protein
MPVRDTLAVRQNWGNALRPQSIIRFEQFYLGSNALAVLLQVLHFTGLLGGSTLAGVAPEFTLSIVLVTYSIVFVFWYLITRRASNVAKWILVVMAGLGLFSTVPLLLKTAETDLVYALLALLILLIQFVGMAFLFRRDAAEWLRSRGQLGVIDVSTFN